MATTKRQKIAYWVVTVLFLIPMAGSGIPELLSDQVESVAPVLVRLGYPLYLMRILGLAKVLGAVAIVIDLSVPLKEWAYAGYTFNLLGAIASHVLAGDGTHALMPAIPLPFVLVSYGLWRIGRQGRPE